MCKERKVTEKKQKLWYKFGKNVFLIVTQQFLRIILKTFKLITNEKKKKEYIGD